MAFFGLAFGVWFAIGTAHSESYYLVRRWLGDWIAGVNVYTRGLYIRDYQVDYPPNALIMLRPLAWLPTGYGEIVWAVMNAGITVGAAWVLVSITNQLFDSKLSRLERATYVLMLIAWTPTRVNIWNGQTTPLVVLLLGLGIRFADSWPVLAGIAFGLGTSKPHVAVAFFVLATFQRRWKLLLIASATAISLALLYCATVGVSPFEVLREYVAVLSGVYGGPQFLQGEVDMRPLWTDLVGDYGLAEPLFLMTAAAMGAVIMHLTWRARFDQGAAISVFGAWLTWGLAVFPFRRYGLMLLAPPIISLMWRPGLRRSLRIVTGWLVFLLVVDIPWILRHGMMLYWPSTANTWAQLTHYSNRVVILLFLAISIVLLSRAVDESPHPHSHPDPYS